jgi:hypothetical protein
MYLLIFVCICCNEADDRSADASLRHPQAHVDRRCDDRLEFNENTQISEKAIRRLMEDMNFFQNPPPPAKDAHTHDDVKHCLKCLRKLIPLPLCDDAQLVAVAAKLPAMTTKRSEAGGGSKPKK